MKLLYLLVLVYSIVFVAAWSPFHQQTPEYNTWDTKQITQWLHDNKIKYKSSQSRDDLIGLVREHWNALASSPGPFEAWSDERILNYLNKKGVDVKESAKNNRDWLLTTAHDTWEKGGYDSEEAYTNVKDWIFDSWSESALKRFLDNHQFGTSAAATKDALLSRIKANYDHIARNSKSKNQEASSWLFDAWSDSELADWLTSHGYSVPRNSDRKTLISLIKKYSYQAASHATSAKDSTQQVLKNINENILDASGKVKDAAFDTWTESDLKAWLDTHHIEAPETPTKDELLALARKNKEYLKQDWESSADYAKTAYDYVADKATEAKDRIGSAAGSVAQYSIDTFKDVTSGWSDNRLKEFLRSRGVIAPENTPTQRLKDLVWKNRQKPIATYDAWSFESWSTEDLQNWLKEQGKSAAGTRDDLVKSAGEYLGALKNDGGEKYNLAISKLQDWYSSGKDTLFDSWSDSDLKAYIDSYGIPTYQGSDRNELISIARRNTYLFRHGTEPESWADTFGKIKSSLWTAADGTKKVSEKVQQQVADGIKKLRQEL